MWGDRSQNVTGKVYEGIKPVKADTIDLAIELKIVRESKQTPRDMLPAKSNDAET